MSLTSHPTSDHGVLIQKGECGTSSAGRGGIWPVPGWEWYSASPSTWEVQAGRSRVKSYSWLHQSLKAGGGLSP